MQWRDYPIEPLDWIPVRELLLSLLLTPALLLPLLLSSLNSPFATAVLTTWLHTQLPSPPPPPRLPLPACVRVKPAL